MANMDYPGPCLSCSAIEGCSTDAERQAGVDRYCKGLEMELNAWKAQLYDVMVQAEDVDSRQRAEFDDTMVLIKSIMRELEMTSTKMRAECPIEVTEMEKQISTKLGSLREKYTAALGFFSPGYLGG